MKEHSRSHIKQTDAPEGVEHSQAELPGKTLAPPPFSLGAGNEGPEKEGEGFEESRDLGGGHASAGDEPPADQGGANPNGLPDTLRSGLESLSGLDLSDVRVKYNSDQPAQMKAHAFAKDREIHLGPGQEQHLPHEGWHIVQQQQGRVGKTLQMKGMSVNDDEALEREADVMGAKAAQLGEKSDGLLQRKALRGGSGGPGVAQLLAVQVRTQQDTSGQNQGPTIREILISGRPERAFTDSMGDHTTAFVVHQKGLQNALLGLSIEAAFAEVGRLVNTMKGLPGFAMIPNLDGRHKDKLTSALNTLNGFSGVNLGNPFSGGDSGQDQKASNQSPSGSSSSSSAPQVSVSASGNDQDIVMGNTQDQDAKQYAPSGDLSIQISKLQEFAATYLEARELIPLSTFNIRKKSGSGGKGKGESSHMSVLEGYCQDKQSYEAKDVKAAIRDLFDLSSVAAVLLTREKALLKQMAPGVLPSNGVLPDPLLAIGETWKQHLASIKVNFPEAADLCGEDDLTKALEGNQAFAKIRQTAMEDLLAAANEVRPYRVALEKGVGELPDNCSPLGKAYQDAKEDVSQIQNVTGIVKLRELETARTEFEAVLEKVDILEGLVTKIDQSSQDQKGQVPDYSTKLRGELDFLWKKVKVKMGLEALEAEESKRSLRSQETSKKRNSSEISADPKDRDDSKAEVASSPRSQRPEKKPRQSALGSQDEKQDAPTSQSFDSPSGNEFMYSIGRGGLGVQIILSSNGEVQDLLSDGRPASPFAGTMGAHTIAWAVHLDHARAAVVGKSLDDALKEAKSKVFSLVVGMSNDLGQAQGGFNQDMSKALGKRIQEKNSLIDGNNVPEPKMAFLQEYLSELLSYTNFIPGVTRDKMDTSGHGEGSHRKKLQEFEDRVTQALSGRGQDNKLDEDFQHLKSHWGGDLNADIQGMRQAITGLFDGNARHKLFGAHLTMIERIYPKVVLALKGAKKWF